MNTENNVVSLEHSVVLHVENAIMDALSNRAGKWVGQHIVFSAADRVSIPNLNVQTVIDQMVSDNSLEKSFQAVKDKFERSIQLPLYRLAPKPW